MACGKRLFDWLIGLVCLVSGCFDSAARQIPLRQEQPVRVATATQTLGDPPAQKKQDPGPMIDPPPPPPVQPPAATMPPGRDVAPAPPPPPVTAASVEAPSTDPAANLRRLLKQAEDECATLDSYICRMTRREMVNGSSKPEEMMLFKFRKQPFSIYFKWIGQESKGREVVYVKDHFENKLHIRLSPGSAPMALAPDSFLIRRSSRHPVTEAGVCAILEKYAAAVATSEKGQHPMRYLGMVKRPDFDDGVVLEGVEDDLAPGADPNLPRGGRRQLYFSTTNHLPMLVITKDERGQEVEYYRFDRFQARVKLDDDDFNPDKLFAKKQ